METRLAHRRTSDSPMQCVLKDIILFLLSYCIVFCHYIIIIIKYFTKNLFCYIKLIGFFNFAAVDDLSPGSFELQSTFRWIVEAPRRVPQITICAVEAKNPFVTKTSDNSCTPVCSRIIRHTSL